METVATGAVSAPRILIVDDDPDTRLLLSMGLKRAGFAVTTATNGQEAMQRLLEGNFAIILVDLMMPVMDGIRFLRWLREDAKITLPAVVLSSSIGGTLIAEATAAGATRFLVKPVQLPELLAAVRALVPGPGSP